jgi:hypothetical protein
VTAYSTAVLPDGTEVGVRTVSSVAPRDVSFNGVRELRPVLDSIHAIAAQVRQTLDSVAPDGAEVTFGIGVDVSPKGLIAVITGIQADASFEVKLKWGK